MIDVGQISIGLIFLRIDVGQISLGFNIVRTFVLFRYTILLLYRLSVK